MADNTYQITLKSGRVFTVRPLPKHFFIYHGELPVGLMEQAVEALKKDGDDSANADALVNNLSADEIKQFCVVTRATVDQFCVKPRLRLEPKTPDEISPYELSDDEFNELSALAMKSAGGNSQAQGLQTFRPQSA